jgi:hypothetical protein
MVSVNGDTVHGNVPAWVVTANVGTAANDPTGMRPGGTFRKLCIVVDAQAGKYVYAYTADYQSNPSADG